MDINEVIKSVADIIENYDNKEYENWNIVYKKIIDSVDNLTEKEKEILLIRVVREITYRGYLIEDTPFKLVKY